MNAIKTIFLFCMFFATTFIQSSEEKKINPTSESVRKSTKSKQEEERTVIAIKKSGNESNRITTIEYSNGDWRETLFCPVTQYTQITTYDAKTNKISRGRPFHGLF